MNEDLTCILQDNKKYFYSNKNGFKFTKILNSIIETLIKLEPLVNDIRSFAGKYDFDERTPGNGYRSFVLVVDTAVKKTLIVCRQVQKKRRNFFFRRRFYEKYESLKTPAEI